MALTVLSSRSPDSESRIPVCVQYLHGSEFTDECAAVPMPDNVKAAIRLAVEPALQNILQIRERLNDIDR